MSIKDRDTYHALPDTVTIYRGCRSKTEIQAYSWTVDREKALWFARRCQVNSGAVVASVAIPKVCLLAYFSDRDESEVILDYLHCDLHLHDLEIQEVELVGLAV